VRSLRLNFELDVEVYSEPFAAGVEAAILRKQGRPVTLGELDARRFPVMLRDAAVRLLLPYL
jgi:cardiolipin synthase